MTVFEKNWLRTSFWKQLLGKYTSPELDPEPDPVPDLAVKIPDPLKRSGSGSSSWSPLKFRHTTILFGHFSKGLQHPLGAGYRILNISQRVLAQTEQRD
jgi:hypothetical protein